MEVHATAAEGFARSADAYERGRPGYPREAIAWLGRRLGLEPGRTILDVAAGTGKLSRPLARTGARVLAVEPVAEMRSLIGPGVSALAGTAEALPLPDASVDAITVGQAFHWFDCDAALAELHRVLRPGGALALLWNRRRLEDPIHAAIDRILAPYRGDVPSHRSAEWRKCFDRTELFGPFEERGFENAQVLDGDGLVDRIGSTSFVSALPAVERAGVLSEVRALTEAGPVTLRYVTEVQVCGRRPNAPGPPSSIT